MACHDVSQAHLVGPHSPAVAPVPAEEDGNLLRSLLIAVPLNLLLWAGIVTLGLLLRRFLF